MNNLTKSVLIVNQFIGLLIGSNFITPIEYALEEYLAVDFIM